MARQDGHGIRGQGLGACASFPPSAFAFRLHPFFFHLPPFHLHPFPFPLFSFPHIGQHPIDAVVSARAGRDSGRFLFAVEIDAVVTQEMTRRQSGAFS